VDREYGERERESYCRPGAKTRASDLAGWGVVSGGGGIRTRGALSRTLVFKTSAFNRSATPPGRPSDASRTNSPVGTDQGLDWSQSGEVAEWLKALAC
jgi:hypothetical protein